MCVSLVYIYIYLYVYIFMYICIVCILASCSDTCKSWDIKTRCQKCCLFNALHILSRCVKH